MRKKRQKRVKDTFRSKGMDMCVEAWDDGTGIVSISINDGIGMAGLSFDADKVIAAIESVRYPKTQRTTK